MYLRTIHAESDISSLRRFIQQNPLGILITALPSPNFPTIQCTHIPWILDVTDKESETELGRLRGHLARANPHSKAMVEAVVQQINSSDPPSNGALEQEVSVIFNGAVDSYVTPKFYTKSKPETGKVVPTWDYSAVQVYGSARIYFDIRNDHADMFLQKQISDLTRQSEESVKESTHSATPWEVSDAPTSYVNILKKSIIGIEVEITRLEGKYKMSQEMGKEDREGVIEGFESFGTENASKMAQTVRERGDLKDARTSASSKG
ncbi:MAG: hypothetical protein Q9225_006590 [Loekoesia sp. 1 TL-2023]